MRWTMKLVAIGLCVLAGAQGARGDEKANEFLKKCVAALGDEKKILADKKGKYQLEGSFQIQGMDVEFSMETTYDGPNKEATEMTIKVAGMEIPLRQIKNGDKVKMIVNKMEQQLPQEAIDELHQSTIQQRVIRVAPILDEKMDAKIESESTKVNGVETVVLSVRSEKLKEVKIYFDKKTLLMVKLDSEGFSQEMKKCNQEQIFSEYKEVHGYKRPLKLEVIQDGKPFMKATGSNHQILEKVDPKLFDISD
jgi:hypothetical protein